MKVEKPARQQLSLLASLVVRKSSSAQRLPSERQSEVSLSIWTETIYRSAVRGVVALSSVAALCAPVRAADFVYVSNVGQLNWQWSTDGRVYLRNLNQFNGSFAGCCYSYYIDTTTPAGKSLWAAVLAKMSMGQPIYLGVDSAAQVGPVIYAGNW